MLKVWNLSLIIVAFALTIFGTFLTRSGILSSIHAFSSGPVGALFLGFLAFVLVASFGLLAMRADKLKGPVELDSALSRESAFLLNNVVLVCALFTIFLGTVFPLIAEAVVGDQLSVGAPYFNSVTTPLFLLLVFLMGVGPMIAWRKASWDNLKRNFFWPATAAISCGFALVVTGLKDFFPVLAFALCVFVVATIVLDVYLAVRARGRLAGERWHRAMVTLVRRNQRRYGGFVVHLGVVLIVLGIAGSMSYSVERQATLGVGETLDIGHYRIRFDGLSETPQLTHQRVTANFRVFNSGHDRGSFAPALKFFPNSQSPVGRAVFRSTLREDFYLILSGFSEVGQNRATFKVLVRPLVVWIWIGGFIMAAGTLLAVMPLGTGKGNKDSLVS